MSRSRVATRRVVRTVFIACLVTAPVVTSTACRAFAHYDYATLEDSATSDVLHDDDSARDLVLSPDTFVRDASGDASGDASQGACLFVPTSVIAHYTFDKVNATHLVVDAQGPSAPQGTVTGTWGS
ncbi:MAG: hypothetical protein KAI47_08860, partial [Deltaproteobacteria bacterium]|nr:hypothetical protein [Deltaproteobacteria bacterium]